ncbi:MAG: hypothetical protein E6Q44_01390 [Flavobacteriales bacterium]|nr:MAG: hypothetical protein E6Q44_01390 [Flavobacteriales bacterium]
MRPSTSYRRPTSIMRTSVWVALVAVVVLGGCVHEPLLMPDEPDGGNGQGGSGGTCDPDSVFFDQQVLPLLVSNCAVPGCHNTATDDNRGIEITSYATLMNSDIIRVADPLDSDLWEVINDPDPDDRMPPPPQSALTTEQKDLIRRWLVQGARNNSCADAACDTVNVTYTATIAPLVAQRCGGCHGGGSPQGGLHLGSWDVLNSVAMDGRLAAAIQHLPGVAAMPPYTTPLPDCRIRQFLIWIEDGAPNN